MRSWELAERRLRSTTIGLAVVLLSLTGCGRDAPTPPAEVESIRIGGQYVPYQVVTISPGEGVTDSLLTGRLVGSRSQEFQSIVIRRAYDDVYGFEIPEIAADDYTLLVLVGGREKAYTLVVAQATDIPDPMNTAHLLLDNVEEAVGAATDRVRTLGIQPGDSLALEEEAAALRSLVTTLRQALQEAPPDDRERAVRWMAANAPALLDSLAARSELSGLMVTATGLPAIPIIAARMRIDRDKALVLAGLVLMIGALLSCGMASLACPIFLAGVLLVATQLYSLHADVIETFLRETFPPGGVSFSMVPTPAPTPTTRSAAAPIGFAPSVPLPFHLHGYFRTLQGSDILNIAGTAELATAMRSYASAVTRTILLFPESSRPTYTPLLLEDIVVGDWTYRDADIAHVRVDGVSPATISLAIGNGSRDGIFTLRATGRVVGDTPFYFGLTYDDPIMGGRSYISQDAVLLAGAGENFDSGTAGWAVVDLENPVVANPPIVVANYSAEWPSHEGNPGGTIAFTDPSSNEWCFAAPTSYLGDQRAAFGSVFRYDIRLNTQGKSGDALILVGSGLTLHATTAAVPGPTWQTIFIPMMGSSFLVNGPYGPPASDTDLRVVLENVEAVYISPDWATGSERGWLDNVAAFP